MSKSVLFLVMVTTVASVCLNLGYSFQKKGAQKLRDVQFGLRTLVYYLKTRLWVLGIFTSFAGTGLTIFALRIGPISTVQPLLGCGLIFLMLFSRFYLKEHISGFEYAALFLVITGVVFMGLSTSATEISEVFYDPRRLFGYAALAMLIVSAVLILLTVICGEKAKDIRYGIFSGIFYAYASLFTRAMFNGMQKFPQNNFLWFIPLSIVSALIGLSLIQRGFNQGRAVIVIVFNDITNQMIVISGGLFCFKESMPSEPLLFTLKTSAFVLLVSGSVILSRLGRSDQKTSRH